MGRTKEVVQKPANVPAILPAKATELMALQDAAPSNNEIDQVFASGVDIGRLEALDFIHTVANSAILPIYENVKKSKAWRILRNPKSSNGMNFESLDEFCQVKLGKSYGRMQQLTANRNLIGQDAFDQAERLGLHQVDYNAIKSLPAPDQELVRRAVEDAKSRDEVLDLLQELAARHATVAAKLTAELEDAKGDIEAKEARLSKRDAEIDKLHVRLKRIKAEAPDETLAELMKELANISAEAMGVIQGKLRMGFAALAEHSAEHGGDTIQVMTGHLAQIQQMCNALRDDFNLGDPVGDGTPAYLKWAAQQAKKA